jgi:hypothetical protein
LGPNNLLKSLFLNTFFFNLVEWGETESTWNVGH